MRGAYGRFRMCYEQGLEHDPKLEGKVTLRFVINQKGNVEYASRGETTLPDTEMAKCVVAAVRTVVFPEPEGGIVTVVYPIQFAPGG